MCLLATAASLTLVAASLPDGPPPRRTGGFGELTCAECHVGGPEPGTPLATVEIRGLPEAFEPGRTYEVTVYVARQDLARAGFEMAVRFAAGEPLSGLQAGTLATDDPARIGLYRDSSATRTIVYAHHTRAGNRASPAGVNRWALRWTAPMERQAVSFNAAVLAANDDNSNFGDDVNVRAQVIRPLR